jgi:sigma-E factor negative regulatory protein RseA
MMSQEKLLEREHVSALADGQLGGDEFADALEAMAQSEDALSAWHCYHVVGDVLRSADLGDARDDLAFLSRLRSRMAAPVGLQLNDQAVVLDTFQTGQILPVAAGVASDVLLNRSANDSSGRWKMVAGLASMVAVAVVGWHLARGDAALPESAQLAAVPAPSATLIASTAFSEATGVAGPTVMLRDARLDELLAAHKQFGGTSALQMPAGFLRNATFEPSSH